MTIIWPYFFSTIIGYMVIHRTLKDHLSFSLTFCLSMGLGTGFLALLTFLSFFLAGEYSRTVVIYLNILLAGGIFYFLYFKNNPKILKQTFSQIKEHRIQRIEGFNCVVGLTFLITLHIIYTIAQRHPFGEWDAWALWNMKFKFLVMSGGMWKELFQSMHWHTQPDYPLLLPSINIWIYALTNGNPHFIPFATSIVFTFLNGLLLYAGVSYFGNKKTGLLAALLILLHPYYILTATAQYADVILSFYLLASFLLIIIALNSNNKHAYLLTGLFIGLLTFAKNEGIILACFLFSLTSIYLLKNRGFSSSCREFIKYLFFGILLTASSALIFKIFLAPPNRDVMIKATSTHLPFFNLAGLKVIFKYVLLSLSDSRWIYLWGLIGIMFILKLPKLFFRENSIFSLFFLAYASVLIFIYLITSNFDLSWRLSRTFQRISFYLLPSIIFFGFYINWKPQK